MDQHIEKWRQVPDHELTKRADPDNSEFLHAVFPLLSRHRWTGHRPTEPANLVPPI